MPATPYGTAIQRPPETLEELAGRLRGEAIEKTLADRGSRYGDFPGHAAITQRLKQSMVETPNWENLRNTQKEALEMIAHKIGRILNGDPNYHDSWHDIVGYAKLVADELEVQRVQ